MRNNGGTNVSGVSIADSQGWPATTGSCPSRPTSMAVKTTYTCTYTRAAPNVTGTGNTSDYENRLTADSNETIPTVDAAIITIERPPANLQVVKFVSPYKLGDDGDGVPSFGTLRNLSVGRTATVNPTVWYKIGLQNVGGRTATGLTISDSNGALPTNASCPAKPSSLAPSGIWVCVYSKTFSSAQTNVNTVTVASPDSPPDSDDADSVTVTVATCTGTNKLVPHLIGLDKNTGPAAWTAAGFTGTYNNINNGSVVTQNRQAYLRACRRRPR